MKITKLDLWRYGKIKNNNIYIPSVDAKDLYIANNFLDSEKRKRGYQLRTRKGEINYNKYTNTFDYSLDLIKLREVAKKNKEYKLNKEKLTFTNEGKEFSNKIINVTFKYNTKEFNKIKSGTYVKFGYDYVDLTFNHGLALEDNEIVGVIVDVEFSILTPPSQLPAGFNIEKLNSHRCVYKVGNLKKEKTVKEVRQELYSNGFVCEGVEYIRFKRSSGSARVGKCLFIDKRLYHAMHKWEMCGLNIKENDEIDLAALEAYIALPTSSIIDTLEINPKSILIIEDYESAFTEKSIVTEIGNGNRLKTEEKAVEVKNSIFDGQSLIDISAMGKYDQYGMVLLRNLFFKSCCFNTNIQMWFKDNNITEIAQLNGFTLAKDISEIKLITTPSSIKYMKFATKEKWLKKIGSTFGVVKHEKKTHFFNGQMVQAHYQLLNTIKLSSDEVGCLIKPSLDYVNLLNTDPDILKFHVKCNLIDPNEEVNIGNITEDKNEVIYNMLSLSETFYKTKVYYDFKKETCRSYIKNLKKGHILINGNYSTLFGNPYEMLLQSINKFDGKSSIPPGNIHSTRFEFGKDLLGCRSPHISTSNILLTNNMKHDLIDQYFNLTDEIVCINSIDENILERLSGADFDSDTCILSDDKLLISAASKYYNIFNVPANQVTAKKVSRKYCAEHKADLDTRTGTNKIGEIVNLSQELNSLMWSLISDFQQNNKSANWYKDDEIRHIYYDICQLNVMSCIEIDKAKKEFSVDNEMELKQIRERYKRYSTSSDKVIKPKFLGYIAKTKGFYDPDNKEYVYHDTTMDYLLALLNKYRSTKTQASSFVPLTECFNFNGMSKEAVNWKQISKIVVKCQKTNLAISNIWTNNYYSSKIKALLTKDEKEKIYYFIKSMKINKHTMLTLITYIEQKKHSKISKLLFYTLYNYDIAGYKELINELKPTNVKIEQSILGELVLHNIRYKKTIV